MSEQIRQECEVAAPIVDESEPGPDMRTEWTPEQVSATEPTREQAIDRQVQRRLPVDHQYRHAENAEQQAAREATIMRDEERRYDEEHDA